ncbi:MAG: esterase/lipase family protein [Microthrixaceae bacterium]
MLAVMLTVVFLAACIPQPSGPPRSGINNFGCKPAAGKAPVVMLHGLGANAGTNWFTKAPLIKAAGYCVFIPTYGVGAFGIGGLKSMRDSAAEISSYVNGVLAATGASKVDLVGHSEGSTVSAYYMKFLGGDTKVRNFVGFGSVYRGTTSYGLSYLANAVAPLIDPFLESVCMSCSEFLYPSQFIDDLNAGGVSVPGPRYTNIVTRIDEVVIPYTSGIIAEPGVTNITLQDHCPFDLSGHLALATDPNVTALILWALAGQVSNRPVCVPWVAPI